MIIGIDASRASNDLRTGTENYSLNLILNLAKVDRYNHYILYVRDQYAKELDTLPKNFEIKIIPNKKFWTQIGLSAEIYRNKPDVLFVPAYVLPIITPKTTAITVHDLAWKYFPEAYDKRQIKIQELSIKRAIKKKSKIIVYSKSTYNDLVKYFKVDKNKVFFVEMGFESSIINEDMSPELSKKIVEPFILSVGRLEIKKNTINLIKAYKTLRKERKIKHKLVLVGKPGFGNEKIQEEIGRAGEIKKDIIQTGFVSDSDLANVYSKADVFVFASLYEGFGYPILEAFAAGVPVITSNCSSMPEIAGGGAILVNPKKPFEITAAISQILNKANLRDKLITKGKSRLRHYSWSSCAEETLKVLESK
jgi:glycosyltransferase involved in cell wall biosynthesis